MNGQMILSSSVVLAIFFLILGLLYSVLGTSQLKKRKNTLAELHQNLKVGSEVMFNGGLTGIVTKISEDFVHIEMAHNLNIKASRYAITEIIS